MMKYIDEYVCAFGNQHACFESSLTVSDWASWVQAIGGIAAIAAAFVVGNRQTRVQVAVSRANLAEENWQTARTMRQFASSAHSAINYVSAHLATREHVHTVATEGFGNTMAELDAMEKMLASVPVYQFHAALAQCLLLIAGTIRQFRMKVGNTIDWHRAMDAAAFADFFLKPSRTSNDQWQTRRSRLTSWWIGFTPRHSALESRCVGLPHRGR